MLKSLAHAATHVTLVFWSCQVTVLTCGFFEASISLPALCSSWGKLCNHGECYGLLRALRNFVLGGGKCGRYVTWCFWFSLSLCLCMEAKSVCQVFWYLIYCLTLEKRSATQTQANELIYVHTNKLFLSLHRVDHREERALVCFILRFFKFARAAKKENKIRAA